MWQVAIPHETPVGYGASATGGKAIYHVANLRDAGPGSLRDAVSVRGRSVVFDVSGTITLRSELHIASDTTIDGATAPSPGITLFDQPVSLSGSKNAVLRYLRLRQGIRAGKHKSSLEISKGMNLRFEHLSIEWGRWDCIDVNDSRAITFQNCLIGEGIGPQRFGCLCGSDDVTFFQCLFVDNQSRNPKAKGRVQFFNNVVYNWGVTGFVGGHSAGAHYADLIGNYFIAGPSSSSHFVGEFTATDHLYQRDNVVDLYRDGKLGGRAVLPADFGTATIEPMPTCPAETAFASILQPPDKAFSLILANAGDTLPRDAVDARLVAAVASLGHDGAVVEDAAEDKPAESTP